MADQQYTQEQFAAWIDKLFADHDVNGDNLLDHGEAKAALKVAHERFGKGNPFNDDRFDESFKAMDTNSDGNIDKTELFNFLH